jgi:peptide deformylase
MQKYEPKELKRIQFGDPILRRRAKRIIRKDVGSPRVQALVEDMRFTLTSKKLGIGIAAPQVGSSLSLAVIVIMPSETRPEAEPFDLVMINPRIIEVYGKRQQLWEGCISAGSTGEADLFAKVPRYKKVAVSYIDEHGLEHQKTFTDLPAHVIQHEIDHLDGILFVDRVKDTKTYMTYREYLKMKKREAVR